MLTDSVDQKSGQDTAGMASFCSTVSKAGKLKGWELESFEGSFIHVSGSCCWLLARRFQFLSTRISPNDLVWASLSGLSGFPRACIPKRESHVEAVSFL